MFSHLNALRQAQRDIGDQRDIGEGCGSCLGADETPSLLCNRPPLRGDKVKGRAVSQSLHGPGAWVAVVGPGGFEYTCVRKDRGCKPVSLGAVCLINTDNQDAAP